MSLTDSRAVAPLPTERVCAREDPGIFPPISQAYCNATSILQRNMSNLMILASFCEKLVIGTTCGQAWQHPFLDYLGFLGRLGLSRPPGQPIFVDEFDAQAFSLSPSPNRQPWHRTRSNAVAYWHAVRLAVVRGVYGQCNTAGVNYMAKSQLKLVSPATEKRTVAGSASQCRA
jgi:hypothetical protein